jgi:GT2 family glycosyltransferase
MAASPGRERGAGYFPLYVEDVEYSYRALRLGVAVRYAPAPVLYHKVSATLGRASVSPRTMYLWVKHRAYFVRRNLTGASRLFAWGYLAVTKAGRAAVELLRGRPAMASAVLRGAIAGLLGRGARDDRAPYPLGVVAAATTPAATLATTAAPPGADPDGV